MRKVLVFSTKGKKKAEITTDAKVWSELKPLVKKEGYDMDSLLATENINRTDLANDGAKLPEGDFTLFLRPTKTKSGAKDYANMGFKDLRAELTDADKTAISESTGKNYTRCSTDDLRNYLISKAASGSVAPAPAEEADAQEVAPNVADVVTSLTNSDRVSSIQTLLSNISENSSSQDVKERVDIVLEEVAGLKDAVNEENSPGALAAKQAEEAEAARQKAEAEEKKRKEKEEEERLEQEAKDLMSGF